jgi:predicted acetyltransferase
MTGTVASGRATSTIEVVDVAPADMERFVALSLAFFGEAPPDEGLGTLQQTLNRSLVARLDGEDIGTAAVIDFQLTLPGGNRVPMDGVTWVAVSPVARRRGAMRAMMNDMLEHARARRIPVLGLGASESLIYRRFGYGVASHIGIAEIDTAHAALRVPFTDPGHVRMQALDGAVAIFLDIEGRQTDRVGGINRAESSWRRILAGAAKARDGMSPLQVAVHVGADGQVDGFVNYRVEQRWPDEISDGVTHVRELAALNLDAHVALWQHVLSMDLMEHLRAERYWLDDPIKHLLLDGRRLKVKSHDDLHLRVVDVVATLRARRYSREDALVIEVRDPAAADIAGRYRLEGGLDGATAAPTDAAADIVLDAPSLGSLMLGDVSAAALHRAGLIEEARDGAVRRASAMFSWSPRPWLNYMF